MDSNNTNITNYAKQQDKEMSLAKARDTLWPVLNQSPKTGQPMGKLLDAGILTDRDLSYLLKSGHEPSDRKAAQVLLLDRLHNLDTSQITEPLKITSPKTWTYSERKQHQFAVMQGIIIGFVLGFAIALEIHLFSKVSLHQLTKINYQTITILIPIALVMVILAIIFRKVLDRIMSKLDKEVENHRKGRIGEELTARIIQQTLTNNWSVYLNLLLPEKKGADMDAVLVGPPGIWILEVKNLEGQFRNTGEQWEFLNGSQWEIAKQNPTKQVNRNAARLCSFLKADGIDKVYVEKAIVWVNMQQEPKTENPMAAVWTIDSLQAELTRINKQSNRLKPERQKSITDKLDSLYKTRDEKSSRND